MLNFFRKADSRRLIFSVFLFTAFAILAYLFPYSGDDWAWGSEIGSERLANWFEDYNGRYAGNLLVMALTRSKALCVAVMAVCLVFAGLLPSLFIGTKDFISFALGAVLLLIIPRDVFVQAVVWTSGFSNYVPPILLTLSYFVTVKNIFGKEEPCYRPFVPIVCLLTGFTGALFMENVTLFNIAAALFVAIFTFVRFKKVCGAHIMYFVGSVSGAVLMFTNSAYGLIARGEDFYRSAFYERGFTDTVTENIKETFERLFASNTPALTLLSVICAVFCIAFLKGGRQEKKRPVALTAMYVNFICLGAIYCKGRLDDWELFYNNRGYAVASALIFLLVGLLYFISTAVVIYLCVDRKETKEKALFLLFSVPVIIAPLILVNPVGPRCFFPPCLLLNCLSVLLFTYLGKKLSFSESVQKGLGKLLVCLTCVLFSFLIGVYGVIHYYDATRTEYIKKQTDEGFKNVVAYYLPFNGYVWNGDPDSVPWDESYKKFYDIDEKVKFKFILWDAFESFKENFEKR